MRYVKTDGIVISEINSGEADKILTVFTKKLGKIQVLSRGCRRPRSKFLASSQIFCYSDLVVYKSQDMYVLSNGEVKYSFNGIGTDIEKLSCATFICDSILKTIEENMVNLKLLKLSLNTLYMLSDGKGSSIKYLIVYMIRFLDIAGLSPVLDRCTICKNKNFTSPKLYFSVGNGGIVCEECFNKELEADVHDNIQLTWGAYKAVVFILYSVDKNIFNFNITDKLAIEIYEILKKYYRKHFEFAFSSLDFIDKVT